MSALFDLTGKTALVTGSSRGLGFSYAEGLAAAGASVILNGTQPATVQAAVERLQSQGLQARGFAFDVTDEQAIEAVFNQLDEERVEVDIVINNAGIQYRSPLLNLELEQWQRVLDTNLTSAFIVGRAAARRMIARGKGGKIINIGSLTSQAAKGGIKMLTCSMAAEWAEFNIQSNAIGPGYILTDMNAALVDNPEFDAWVKASNPSKRWGKPEELIGTAVYLASNASNYVNGQIIYVDGGWLAVL